MAGSDASHGRDNHRPPLTSTAITKITLQPTPAPQQQQQQQQQQKQQQQNKNNNNNNISND